MKHLLIVFIIACLFQNAISQARYFSYPNEYNKFINSEKINWATETHDIYNFVSSNKILNKNIYDFIISNALSQNIAVYKEIGMFSDSFISYTFLSKNYYRALSDSERNFITAKLYNDSLKAILFEEILYLEDYSLKCQIISASPQYFVITELGINLGPTGDFVSCLNNNYLKQVDQNDDILLVKQIDTSLDFTQPNNARILKETYGMNLVSSLWYGAYIGKNIIIDVVKNVELDQRKVMDYTIFDSIYTETFDAKGNNIVRRKRQGVPVKGYLANAIQYSADLYYNRTKNIFFSVIKDVYLFADYRDFDQAKDVREKRFKILFK